MSDLVTINKFSVSPASQADPLLITINNINCSDGGRWHWESTLLTPDDAILLAAWLAVTAHDDGSAVLERMAAIKGERWKKMSDFIIRGYAGHKHPGARRGAMVLETTHKSEASASIEIEAYRERMKRGEIDHVELLDCRPGGALSNCDVRAHTPIAWSWCAK